MPLVAPVTRPATEMTAFVLVQLHVPPVVESASKIPDSAHTITGPAIIAACGIGLIVIIFTAVAVPQTLVTV